MNAVLLVLITLALAGLAIIRYTRGMSDRERRLVGVGFVAGIVWTLVVINVLAASHSKVWL